MHWKKEFDYKGYVPTKDSKARSIAECEIQERAELDKNPIGRKDRDKKFKGNLVKDGPKKKTQYNKNNNQPDGVMFYCLEHGKNKTHATKDCYTLKNRAERNDGKSEARTFSAKKFCKEVHMLSKGSSRKKVLNMFSAEITREKAKMNKKPSGKKAIDSDSDSSTSVHMLNNDEVGGVGNVTWGSNNVGAADTAAGRAFWAPSTKKKLSWGEVAMRQQLSSHLCDKKKKIDANMMETDVADDPEPMAKPMEEDNAEDAKVKEVTERVKNLGRPKDDSSD
jgi:hypothetical protein